MTYPSARPGSDAVLVGRSDSGKLPVHEHPPPLHGWLFGICRRVDGKTDKNIVITEITMEEPTALRSGSVCYRLPR